MVAAIKLTNLLCKARGSSSALGVPGYPYHVAQRGNRRRQVLSEDSDYALYRDLLADAAERASAQIWAYCVMPNHVHLIVVPGDKDGLRRTFADAYRRYTGFIYARHRWTGHLWQGRFGAVVIDEAIYRMRCATSR